MTPSAAPFDAGKLAGLVAAATKGPWVAETSDKSASICILGRLTDPMRIRPMDGYGLIVAVDCATEPDAIAYSPMDPEQIANAALIAMAPDLAAEVLRLTTALTDRDKVIREQTEGMALMAVRLEEARVHVSALLDEVGSYDPDWDVTAAARAWRDGKAGAA